MKTKLNLEFMAECFDVDFDNGVLYWKQRPESHFKTTAACKSWNKKLAGKRAGSKLSPKNKRTSYIMVHISKVGHIFAHHIIFCMYHKIDQVIMLDHLDQNGLNNSITNLVRTSPSKNMQNKRKYLNNKTNIVGVSWHSNGCWEAKIGSGRNRARKLFKDFFEACCFRKSKELEFGYSMKHGR